MPLLGLGKHDQLNNKLSLRNTIIKYFVFCGVIIALIFFINLFYSVRIKKEITHIQNNISVYNSLLYVIQDYESSSLSYVSTGDPLYFEQLKKYHYELQDILDKNRGILNTNDDMIIYFRTLEQVNEAIYSIICEFLLERFNSENSFLSIRLVTVGFNYISSMIYSMLSNQMGLLSELVSKTSALYSKFGLIERYIFFISMTVLLFYMNNIASAVIKGFKRIRKAAEKLTVNDWDFEDLPENEYVEIDITSKAFNNMKKTIKENLSNLQEQIELKDLLAKKTIESEKQKRLIKDTQLKLLQAQINPHFLFNTLNMVINNVRLGYHRDETANILVATSRLLRDSIEIKEQLISLDKELELLDNYITIQKERNKGRIDIIFEVEECLPKMRIPPFTLQPLVENCIVHGLKDSMAGEIQIHAFGDDVGGVFISISDNGYGISADIIRSAMDGCLNSKGLGNVIKRLKLIYNNPDIILFSKQDVGTTVNIHLVNSLQRGSLC